MFYKKLNDDCQTLSQLSKDPMDVEKTGVELLKTRADSGADSAPGPDNTSYYVYRKLWDIVNT